MQMPRTVSCRVAEALTCPYERTVPGAEGPRDEHRACSGAQQPAQSPCPSSHSSGLLQVNADLSLHLQKGTVQGLKTSMGSQH